MYEIPAPMLAKSVPAWEGPARSQRLSVNDPRVLFTGGGQQLCVPQLTWGQIARDYTGYGQRRMSTNPAWSVVWETDWHLPAATLEAPCASTMAR